MSRCYVGNLPADPSENALTDQFEAVGKVLDVQIKKTISNDWYAFVHYAESEAAEDAVRKFDGTDFHGNRLRVELPFVSRRQNGPRSRPGGYRPPANGPRVTIRVYNIPETGSWQDLKDHFREAGDCVFADAYGDGTGVVEFTSIEDAERAMRRFDDSTFRSHQGESARLRLELLPPGRSEHGRDRGGGRYDSPYRGRRDDRREDYPAGPTRRSGGYGPIRDRGHEGRARSPPPRRGSYHRRSSPQPYRYEDERYTTQDSRSTEAVSSGRSGPTGHVPNDDRRSPLRGKESSWGAVPPPSGRGESAADRAY